jgi:hypothetical protein
VKLTTPSSAEVKNGGAVPPSTSLEPTVEPNAVKLPDVIATLIPNHFFKHTNKF